MCPVIASVTRCHRIIARCVLAERTMQRLLATPRDQDPLVRAAKTNALRAASRPMRLGASLHTTDGLVPWGEKVCAHAGL